ncbi:ankyrin repeat domain-containing protein 13C-A-like [Lolium rigidum]|uniref:ankyrin repeat domain-containing protein 13C-A-like n=1 Tax=Lolium rigidum TaxID=89674 RepID=UPI001F5D28E9|nr:ankyrin repeat domain-containing protein 13C-A-like [Lolium rigidum]
MDDLSRYAHSPAHLAVARRDHTSLRSLVASLPRLPRAGEITTEAQSIAAESLADAVSAAIDRRDVPRRETPLHLAVRLRDPVAADILMTAGADWSLQNADGWSALQEAVCTREDAIATVIARHYQPLAWAKWCRRLPRVLASVSRIRDFYMEISFHFESSVIPFIGRIAPSDTYRIWKRGAALRADMTLAGFDGFRIQRSDQTFLFLGDGARPEDAGGKELLPGSLIVLSHKDKEITDALEGAGVQPTESEVAHEVALMSKTNMYRPGIDVTQADLVPHVNWRRQERTEAVGQWKAKVYDMLNVLVTVKSRRVPGAMTDEELFAMEGEEKNSRNTELETELDDVLTAEERKQLDSALRGNSHDEEPEDRAEEAADHHSDANGGAKDKKGWFWGGKKGGAKSDEKPPKAASKDESSDPGKGKEKGSGKKKKGVSSGDPNKLESEYKKGLRPVLWLTPDFPLKTDELIPLLDVLANKVKAVRRLRELLTTKLPTGTFPVKIAIPIVPTIRVIVTFTKFEELQPLDEFATPPTSPTQFQDAKSKDSEGSASWYSWVRGGRGAQSSDSGDSKNFKDEVDPFHIPSEYTWVDANEKKRRMKAKKAKNRRGAARKQSSKSTSSEGGQRPMMDGFE